MGLVGATNTQKYTATGVKIAAVDGCAISAPAGTRTRPNTKAKATKVSRFGSSANSMSPAKAAARPAPTPEAQGPAMGWSALGADRIDVMAAKVIAEAPLGHAVMIQNKAKA